MSHDKNSHLRVGGPARRLSETWAASTTPPPTAMGKSNAGRKPYDTILKFKIMVLQSLHNLSDDRTEYLIRDRISFMRFLDLFSWIVIHVGDVVHRSKDEFLARRGDSTVRAITDAV